MLISHNLKKCQKITITMKKCSLSKLNCYKNGGIFFILWKVSTSQKTHSSPPNKSTKKPYHELAVHVERVLPVAELEWFQALTVQQAGSALLDHKRRV
jgi:hypothetical protein